MIETESQTKWENRTGGGGEHTNEAEIVIIPDKELKPKVIKMLNELKRIKEHSESFNKGLGNIKEPIIVEEYNNWNGKCTTGNQQQVRW